jgi:hypothetical protein
MCGIASYPLLNSSKDLPNRNRSANGRVSAAAVQASCVHTFVEAVVYDATGDRTSIKAGQQHCGGEGTRNDNSEADRLLGRKMDVLRLGTAPTRGQIHAAS